MSAVLEYAYEYKTRHLDDKEALEKYESEKKRNPNAIVVLDELDCGHWDVQVYESQEEKEEYLRERLADILERFISNFRK
jgi:hypothetical protein